MDRLLTTTRFAHAEVSMSGPDPRDNVTPEPLESHPHGSPLDRPPTDGGAITPHPAQGAGGGPAYPDYGEDLPVVLPPRKPHPHFGWAILWTIGFFVVSQIVGSVIGLPIGLIYLYATNRIQDFLKLAGDAEALQQSEVFARLMMPAVTVIEVLSILYGLVALRIIAGPAWPRKVALRLPSLPHFVLTLLLVPAFMLIAQAVNLATRDYVPSLGGLEAIGSLLSNWPVWLSVLLIGVGPGIGEELFCRGFLGRGLVANHGYVLGVIMTSVLFGLMHVEPQQVIYAPVLGLLLHFVYLTTRSLLLPMLLHTLNNSLSVLQAWSETQHAEPAWLKAVDAGGLAQPFLPLYAGAVVLAVAVCVGLYFSRARLASADGSGPPPWTPGYPNVEYPPPHTGTVVAHPPGPALAALGLGLFGLLAFVACCYVTYSLS
jgi:uncharacterized protein